MMGQKHAELKCYTYQSAEHHGKSVQGSVTASTNHAKKMLTY